MSSVMITIRVLFQRQHPLAQRLSIMVGKPPPRIDELPDLPDLEQDRERHDNDDQQRDRLLYLNHF